MYPDAPAKFVNVDEWPDAAAKNAAFEVFRWIDNLDPAALGAERDEDRGLSLPAVRRPRPGAVRRVAGRPGGPACGAGPSPPC